MVRCLGYFIQTTLAPNRRAYDSSAMRNIIKSLPAGRFTPIIVDSELSYSVDATKLYVDITLVQGAYPYFGASGMPYIVFYTGKGVEYNSAEEVPDKFKFTDRKMTNVFFAFTSRIDTNSLSPNTFRVYYRVDWWSTFLVHYDRRPYVCGEIERAHVNDLIRVGGGYTPSFSDFTNEPEMTFPSNAYASQSRCVKHKVTVIDNSDEGIDMQEYSNRFAFLVMALRNTSGLTDPKHSQYSVAMKENAYGSTVYPNTVGIVYFTALYMGLSASPIFMQVGKDFPYDYVGKEIFDNITDDRIIAMYITQDPPSDVEIIYKGNNQFDFRFDYSKNPAQPTSMVYDAGDVSKYMKVYPVDYPDYYPVSEEVLNLQSGIGVVPYDETTVIPTEVSASPSVEESAVSAYLNKFIVKAHTNPYCSLSFYSGGNTTLFDVTVRKTYGGLYAVREPITGSYIVFTERGSAPLDSWKQPTTSYVFYNTGLFTPPFSENWLNRQNALDEASHSKVQTALGATAGIMGTITGVGADIANIVLNPASLQASAGDLMSTPSRVLENAGQIETAVYTARVADRAIEAYGNDYFVRGSVPSQATVGIIGDDMLYVTHTYLNYDNFASLVWNLHLYGYKTKLDLYQLLDLDKHRRTAFNFVKTIHCQCLEYLGRPDTSAREATLFGSLDVVADIQSMFDRGVFLLVSPLAEQTLRVTNLPYLI